MNSVILNISVFKFFKKIVYFFVLSIGVSDQVNCQALQLKQITIPDTVYNRSAIKTSVGLISLHLSIWAGLRLVKKPFAYISLETIRHNFKTGFMWDNDGFETNMWDHPMQGNFNFNIARYNGYNHWQSYIYNFGGSLFWEMFLENEPPSLNDQISTVVGGQAIGEVTYRISDCIMTPYKRSFKRVSSELANTVLVPTETIRRIINGDIWQVKKAKYNPDSEIESVEFMMGPCLSSIITQTDGNKINPKITLNFNTIYNDPFITSIKDPFDHFTLKTSINLTSDHLIINKLNIEGLIFTKRKAIDSKNKILYGIVQHYDYYVSDSIDIKGHEIPYKFSAPASYGLTIKHQYQTEKLSTISEIHTNAILIGAGITDHYNLNHRNYNFGPGYSYKIRTTTVFKELVKFYAEFMSFRIFTPKGYIPNTEVNDDNFYTFQGDIGNSMFNILNAGIEFNLIKRLILHLDTMHSFRKNIYKYYPEVYQADNEFNICLFYRM
jgi:hypothetical protein